MVEKQNINGKEVWLTVDAQPVERENPNIIPTEYFIAAYSFSEAGQGRTINDEDGQPKLFESPVAALSYARKRLEKMQ